MEEPLRRDKQRVNSMKGFPKHPQQTKGTICPSSNQLSTYTPISFSLTLSFLVSLALFPLLPPLPPLPFSICFHPLHLSSWVRACIRPHCPSLSPWSLGGTQGWTHRIRRSGGLTQNYPGEYQPYPSHCCMLHPDPDTYKSMRLQREREKCLQGSV